MTLSKGCNSKVTLNNAELLHYPDSGPFQNCYIIWILTPIFCRLVQCNSGGKSTTMQNCYISRVGPIESKYMLIGLKVEEELSQRKNVIRLIGVKFIVGVSNPYDNLSSFTKRSLRFKNRQYSWFFCTLVITSNTWTIDFCHVIFVLHQKCTQWAPFSLTS